MEQDIIQYDRKSFTTAAMLIIWIVLIGYWCLGWWIINLRSSRDSYKRYSEIYESSSKRYSEESEKWHKAWINADEELDGLRKRLDRILEAVKEPPKS